MHWLQAHLQWVVSQKCQAPCVQCVTGWNCTCLRCGALHTDHNLRMVPGLDETWHQKFVCNILWAQTATPVTGVEQLSRHKLKAVHQTIICRSRQRKAFDRCSVWLAPWNARQFYGIKWPDWNNMFLLMIREQQYCRMVWSDNTVVITVWSLKWTGKLFAGVLCYSSSSAVEYTIYGCVSQWCLDNLYQICQIWQNSDGLPIQLEQKGR